MAVIGHEPCHECTNHGLRRIREPTEQWSYDKLLTTLRESLSDDEIKNPAAEGAQLREGHAVAEALAV
jgi:hypothetical protein